jgi:virginiamycin B lyase
MTMRIRLACLLLLAWTARADAAPGWTEFLVPEGSGPHDVAPAPDGMVWFTAQVAGALGRLDPHTAMWTSSRPVMDRRRAASSSAPMGRPG